MVRHRREAGRFARPRPRVLGAGNCGTRVRVFLFRCRPLRPSGEFENLCKIIHITDVHLVPEGRTVVGMDPAARFAEVVETVNTRHADADICIVSGDLTDHGDIDSYLRLGTLLEKLQLPVRLMMGNHDKRSNFRLAMPGMADDGSGYVQSVADFGDLRLILLDTLDDANAGTGILCRRRLSWFSERLAEARHQRIVVFMHHPPRSVGLSWFDDMMLEETSGFWSLVDAHPNVEHIAFGHLHVTTAGRWGRVSFSCNRGTCHRITLGSKTDAVEFVESEPTFDIITATDGALLVHHSAPVFEQGVIAREYPTDDGKGRLEFLNREKFEALAD
ncbi:phosphodiesterase (plasmid) [Roseibium aggregatum]|nr:phosphodiesterase [Roseibium aggregatum]